MKKYYIIGISIIITGIVIGGSLIAIQNNKQSSIEYQLKLKINQQNYVLRLEREEKENIDLNKEHDKYLTNLCIEDAEDAYWEYMKLNGKEDDDGTVWASDKYWDKGDRDKQQAIDNCYKRNN